MNNNSRYTEQQLNNHNALLNPQIGDYWNEMFCPYFLVVDVKGDKFTVLSCMNRPNEPNAKIDYKSGAGWNFDYSKSMVVTRDWIEKAVRYKSIDGFVADVFNSEKTRSIVTAWRNFVQQQMQEEIRKLEEKWEEFTGWKYLKEENV